MDFYTDLSEKLGVEEQETKNCLILANHPHRFVKVAFDVYRDKNGTGIWKVEKKNGKEFIIRAKTDDLEELKNFDVVADKTGENVTLAFKKVPIVRFASKAYNFDANSICLFSETLRESLRKPEFLKSLIASLDSETKKLIASEIKAESNIEIESDLSVIDSDNNNLQVVLAQVNPQQQMVDQQKAKEDARKMKTLQNQQLNIQKQQLDKQKTDVQKQQMNLNKQPI